MSQLFSTSVTAQNITTPRLIKTWTATASYDDLKLRVLLSGLAGNGTYQACCTIQPGGAGAIYQTPTSSGFAAATVTTMWLSSVAFSVATGDVLKVYVQGLAGDISVDAITALWYGADAPTVGQIDTQLSGTHGAGAWGPSSALGAFTIHIRAQDSSSLLYITDALISIKDNADTTLIDQQRTADDGTATRITTSLNAATYKLHCSVPGYTSVVVSHVITGNEDITLSLAPIVVGSPSVPSQCRVYGFEYAGVGGLPILGSVVSAVLTGPSQVSGNNILEVQAGSTTSDASGYWYLDLTIGKTYKITIPQADIEIEIVVPNLVSVNLKTLLI